MSATVRKLRFRDPSPGPFKLRTQGNVLADSPIEKNLPMPAKRNGPKSPWREKFLQMEVGDSFFVANIERATAANRYSKELGITIQYRKIGNGLRFWRTA